MRVIARRLTGVAIPAILLATIGMNGAAAAGAPAVSCGATLTLDASLTQNLNCPNGNGLTLAQGITLNLGGHQLIGPGSTGVAVTLSPAGGSRVVNGTIRNWDIGINLADALGAPTSRLTGVVLTSARVDITDGDATLTRVRATDSPISSQQNGVLTIADSRFVRSSIDAYQTDIIIKQSVIVGEGLHTGSARGITVDRSILDGTGYPDRLATCGETGVTITNSIVRNYRMSIAGYFCGVTLKNNTFSNMQNGVLGQVGSGFEDPTPYITVTGNVFTGSGTVLQSGAMVVKNNTFVGNTIGIDFLEPQWSTAIGNTFVRNTGSGITTDLPGLTAGENRAIGNGGYGIYAPGAVDLGGNLALGNTLGQCVGLSC